MSFYSIIEKQTLFTQTVLSYQLTNFARIMEKVILKRTKTQIKLEQKFTESPFDDFIHHFKNSFVTMEDIVKIDRVIARKNSQEMQQSYVIDSYLHNMDLHKCQLIQSFKDYSFELYSQIKRTDDFNYISYLDKVRGMYLLPKSDIEVVIVDEDSELYHNTII